MSGILQKVSGRSDVHCSSKATDVEPDTSNVVAETLASDGSEEPSIEKRTVSSSSFKKSHNNGTTTASSPSSQASASASAQADDSSSDTAHPSGLAGLTEGTTTPEGLKVPSVKEMATKLHLQNPGNATRAEVIQKLNVPGALENN